MHDHPANSSYLYGNDSAWGGRYYFTFYSEYGDRGWTTAAEATALIFVLLASLGGNTCIALAILRFRDMRTVTNWLLLNLASADIVFALGIPFVVSTRITQDWLLGDAFCRFLPYTEFVCGSVLLWTLTIISMDRYRCIVVPPYRSALTPLRAVALSGGTWLLASLLFLPVAFWFQEQTVEGGHTICTLVFPRSDTVNLSACFTAPVLIFACFLPMALLVYHYWAIFRKLLATRGSLANSAPPPVNRPPGKRRDSELSYVSSVVAGWARKTSQAVSVSTGEDARMNKHLRVVRILLLNVVVVLLMWLPISVLMLLIYIDGQRSTSEGNEHFFLRSCHFFWALLVALLNTVVNPLLYGFLSAPFRASLLRLWRCIGIKNIRQGCVATSGHRQSVVPEITPRGGGVLGGHTSSLAGSLVPEEPSISPSHHNHI